MGPPNLNHKLLQKATRVGRLLQKLRFSDSLKRHSQNVVGSPISVSSDRLFNPSFAPLTPLSSGLRITKSSPWTKMDILCVLPLSLEALSLGSSCVIAELFTAFSSVLCQRCGDCAKPYRMFCSL